MKMFLLRCAVLALNIASAFIRAFSRRITGKVTLLCSQDDLPSLDIRLLAAAISNGEPVTGSPKVVVLAGRMRRSPAGALKFAGHLLRELYHIATSEVVVLEGYTVSIGAVKPGPGVTVIQMWHAPDAIKKFSRQILDTPAGQSSRTADILGMHRHYDYLLCPSPAAAPAFREAFGVTDDKLVYLGMPRIDYLSAPSVTLAAEPQSTRDKIRKEYQLLQERPAIVYAPTFRDGRPVDLEGLLRNFDFERFTLIVKLHPLDEQNIAAPVIPGAATVIPGAATVIPGADPGSTPPGADSVIPGADPGSTPPGAPIFDHEFTTDEWLTLAAAVITDYSGIAVEAAAAGVPLYFYVYDIDRYMAERGLNFDPRCEAIAPYVFTDAAALTAAIDPATYDLTLLRTFRERMLSCPDTGNTERLADFVRTFLTQQETKIR
ncbi:MAG: CDP-glycerol glycerophosphotransferase family protein [Clostridiales Family XIII bacterium]|jgi:CDP-ribitol ribitolphosphotransferase|nr:CDP-glycerol glycerophosphotransferase family protein [Clostridiales Family XIII bacterium]